ncbi:AMP-binding protein [Xanthobacter sp. KR7-65]|uniref:AMP-binding protein n=1 Tax=Xanthobacter sp. KR7-65 TaxID=3156612 RepID=UPI0032B4AA48
MLNMGVAMCDRHAADPDKVALIHVAQDGSVHPYTYVHLRDASNRLANVLLARGLTTGDRVAVLLEQSPEAAIAHLAALRAGLVSIPLSTLFGVDALKYRLADSGAAAVVTNIANAEKLESLVAELPELKVVLSVGGATGCSAGFETELARAASAFTPVQTRADQPAMMMYTSGTTGNPKGCLHAHRFLLGHVPGVAMPHEFFPQPGDRIWTPADWAWIGGLLNVLFVSLLSGVPVVTHRPRKFDPQHALDLMTTHGVRNLFMPPAALRQLCEAKVPARLALRTIGSGGDPLAPATAAWCQEALGAPVNEFYGQTECNLVLSNCAGLSSLRVGSLGRPVPGHAVALIDEDGQEVPAGTLGTIAVRRPDPVMFVGYWNNPAATEAKFHGDWLVTGDLAIRDDEGFFYFRGRSDDLIKSSGYRIGPGEVEEAVEKHPAVAQAAVIGVPDADRGQIVKAFVVLKNGAQGGPELISDIQTFVRTRLAAHEYPREIAFLPELPRTASGKLQRSALRQL